MNSRIAKRRGFICGFQLKTWNKRLQRCLSPLIETVGLLRNLFVAEDSLSSFISSVVGGGVSVFSFSWNDEKHSTNLVENCTHFVTSQSLTNELQHQVLSFGWMLAEVRINNRNDQICSSNYFQCEHFDKFVRNYWLSLFVGFRSK